MLQNSFLGPLDADHLKAAALRRARRRCFSDETFYLPLQKLVSAYENEAELSVFGRLATRFDIMRCLTNLLNLDAAEEVDASITRREIAQPLFITGLPRASTTFLHTLLAQDPANAVPRSWQLIYPFPPRHHLLLGDYRRDWVEAQLRFFQFISPGMADLHPLSADAPQECTDITAQVFQSMRFDTTYHIPSYQRWFDKLDQTPAFRFHRRFLQHLDVQSPGKQWVLKSPDHIFSLDAIRTVYPDAKIVFLHRDPLSVVASCAKLTEVLRKPFARTVDPKVVGENVAARLIAQSERMAAADGNILHLYFRNVTADPLAAAAEVYAHCGRELTSAAKARMQAWLARTQEGKKRHRYDLAEFGLSAAELRERFRPYVQHFAVPVERGG